MARLEIEIDSRGAVKSIKNLDKEIKSFGNQVKKSEKDIQSFSSKTSSSMKKAGVAIAGFFAVGLVKDFAVSLAKISDEYTSIAAKIRLVTNSAEEFEDVYESLYEQGLKTGTQLSDNAAAFNKLANGMKDVAGEEIVSLLGTVNQSLTVAGASAQETSSFMLQFGQAMGSGVVAGDELRSMIEANSYLMGKLAENLGTNIRGLRDMGSAGTLTRDVFVKALKDISQSVEDDFGSIPLTIEKAVNKLSETWKRMLADADKASGSGQTLAEAISNIADVIEDNKEGILNFFTAVAEAAGWLIERIANLGNALAGLAAYKRGEISFFDFATSGPEELKELLDSVRQTKGEIDKIGEKDLDIDFKVAADTSKAEENLKKLVNLQVDAFGGKTGKGLEKRIEALGKTIEKITDDISDTIKDSEMEINDLMREGMGGEEAWDDLNNQIDEYKDRAAAAAKAGDWEGQADYLKRIKELISGMPDEVTEVVTKADVDRAKKVYEYQLKITGGGKRAYGTAAKDLNEAKKNYQDLLKAQKDGYKTVISEEDALKAKVEATRDINKDIIENKEAQAKATEKEKISLEKLLAEYQSMAEGAIGSTEELTGAVDEVGVGWVKVGDEWTRTADNMVSDVEKIESSIDSAISKMNDLNSGISGSSNIAGARAIGGPVNAGESYLVGEQGREIFTPSVSGFITPNNKIEKSGNNLVDINLSIDGGTSVPLRGPQTSIDELERQAAEKLRYAA